MMTTTIANEAPTATAPPPATPPVTQPGTAPVTPTGSGPADRPADTAGAGHLAVAYAPVCRCGREAHPDVDDAERHLSTHRTAAGHVVYYRCACGRPRFAHLRWADR